MNGLSASTTRAYEGRLNALVKYLKDAGIEYNLFELQKTEGARQVINWFKSDNIKYKNHETLKVVLSALLWKVQKTSDGYQLFHAYFTEVKKVCIANARKQELPENRKSNYLTKTELLEAYQKCYMEMIQGNEDYHNWLVLALYALQPPVRADYCNMKIFAFRSAQTFDRENNYCSLGGSDNSFFLFQKYKTAKTYGSVQVPIHPDIVGYITGRFIQKKEEYVLPPSWTPAYLSERVKTVCKKYTGKECSIGLIRHAWVFDLYKTNPTLAQKEELARCMLHSVAVQELYRTNETPVAEIASPADSSDSETI